MTEQRFTTGQQNAGSVTRVALLLVQTAASQAPAAARGPTEPQARAAIRHYAEAARLRAS